MKNTLLRLFGLFCWLQCLYCTETSELDSAVLREKSMTTDHSYHTEQNRKTTSSKSILMARQVIGKQGGAIATSEIVVTIPEGALSSSVEISLEKQYRAPVAYEKDFVSKNGVFYRLFP